MTELEKLYLERFEQFKQGFISAGEWVAFCEDILYQIMINNKDVFQRLKDM